MGTTRFGETCDVEGKIKPEDKYKIIQKMYSRKKNHLNIQYMCEVAEV